MEGEQPQTGLTDAHNILIQCIMSKKLVPQAVLEKDFAGIKDTFPDQVNPDQTLNDFVSVINQYIGVSLAFQIQYAHDEETGEVSYALTNTCDDINSKLSSLFTPLQLEYFRQLLQTILNDNSDDFLLEENDALYVKAEEPDAVIQRDDGTTKTQAPKVRKKLNQQEKADALRLFVQEKWLRKEKSEYSIGLRTLMELGSYLSRLTDIEFGECVLCSISVFRGINCPNERCGVKAHKYCVHSWMRDKDEAKCPSCSIAWPPELLHGSVRGRR